MKKVYGPYRRKDGRAHVVHYDLETKSRRTQSYPRYLMEQHLGRDLFPEEQVDHINDDPTDDRIENYQLLSLIENVQKSAKKPEMMSFVCPVCGVDFEIRARRYRWNQEKMGRSGPYCSRRCNGLVNH